MRTLLTAAALVLALTGPAWAHSPVTQSDPADGSTVSEAPERLTLTLAEPGRFMKVEVTHTSADGATVHVTDLAIPSRAMRDEMEFAPPAMGAGTYRVEWRVLGEDGHAMDGTVTYTVTAQ